MAPPKEMKAYALGRRWWITILWNAITKRDFSHGVSVKTIPVPTIEPNELLVKVHSVACNPTDWAHVDIVGPAHAIIGCDYAGVVEEIGDSTKGWKVGDRIAGTVHGGLYPTKGAFAEYLRVPYDLAFHPPASLSDHDATTYGISALTAMQGLYTQLSVPWPDEEKANGKEILIYSGATAASLFAIQMAKLAGFKVVTTCSPHNFDLVKSYGADYIYDYHSKTAVSEIKKEHPSIAVAFDGISLTDSTSFCCDVVFGKKGKVVVLLPVTKVGKKFPGVEVIHILMYTLLGEPFAMLPPLGPRCGPILEDRAALVRFYKWLEEGRVEKLKAPPVEVVPGGFEALDGALDRLRKREVSGRKLVLDLV